MPKTRVIKDQIKEGEMEECGGQQKQYGRKDSR